ncbi:MAG: hypothetical protein K2X03_16905 [Bryobacteraceae bacterium]|nr:hypothetical protein [Bryobacteraceae bacterium]
MKRSNWSIALYVVLIFASGVAAGVMGQRLLASNVVSASSTPRTPEQWRARYVDEIRQRLSLDATQSAKVNDILGVTRARYNEVRERNRPEMKRIHDEQVESIRGVLSDTQKNLYAQFLLEKEAEKKARTTSDSR